MASFHEQHLRREAGARLAAGDLAAAEAACRRLLERDGRDVTALQILAAIAFERGRHEQAVELLGRCIALRPRDPDLRCNLAKAWTARGDLDRALAAYDKALRIRARHADALSGKADLLERRGNDDQARAVLARAGEGLTAEMAIVLARLEQKRGDGEAAIETVRSALPGAPPNARRRLLFILGWALERAGAYDEAFDAWREANQIGRRPFDAAAARTLVERMISVFSADAVESMPRSEIDGSRAVFIVSMPRSGSTLVERIIDAHPAAHGAGELAALGDLASSLVFELPRARPYPDCLARMTAQDAERLGRRYLDELARGAPPDAARVTDKNLDNYVHLGLASRLLPGARVVHVRRDPLDTCLSCFAQLLSPRKHAYAADLRDLGTAYRLYLRLMAHWRRVVDLDWLDVEYEELVADQEAVSRRLVEFLGLEWDERCLRFHEAERDVMTLSYAQVRRPMYKESVGRWRRFEKHLGPLREELEKRD